MERYEFEDCEKGPEFWWGQENKHAHKFYINFEHVYDETKQTLRFTMKDQQGRSAVWLFKVDDIKMHGTLVINENTLFRIVELKKT